MKAGILFFVLAVVSWCVAAEPVVRAKEMNTYYDYSGKSWPNFGVVVNADFLRLHELSGATAELLMSPMFNDEKAEQGWLGIAMKLETLIPKELGKPPAKVVGVARVMPGSAAEAAGVLDNDVIVGVDDVPVDDKGDKTLLSFRLAITKKKPGETVKLAIRRGERLLDLTATIQPFPKVKAKLKPHPDLDKLRLEPSSTLLMDALRRPELMDEFAWLLKGFRDEADKVVSTLMKKEDYNAFRLQEVNYLMHHPLDLPLVAHKIADPLHAAFNASRHDLVGLLQVGMASLDMTPSPSAAMARPTDFTAYVERLVVAIQQANAERTAALAALDADEIDFLYREAPKLLTEYQGSDGKEVTAAGKREEEVRTLRLLNLALKLDLPRLIRASAAIAAAIDPDTLKALDKRAGKLERTPAGWKVREERNLTVIDTPAGRVLIGGTGDNSYSEDAVLILDFGGNDSYRNHAGGSTQAMPFAVVIDLAGDDHYLAQENFSQGAGLLGGGFLIDLEGDDRYEARHYAQGLGLFGVGILADLAGNDRYTALTAAQGTAAFGIGLLTEGVGDDSYSGQRFVQGVGYVKGFGAMVEAAGNDSYFAGGAYPDFREPGKAYQSLSQGFGYGMRPWESFVGASGGIGVIAEAEGNDTYVADYFAQGSAYWYALGVLDDRKGHDRYLSGRYSQGAGIHMAAGVLIDGEGDDNYLATYGVAQGCGHDYGVGFLIDNGGNDRYVAGVVAQGAGNDNGIGVLIDNGGSDQYLLRTLGQGRGNLESVRNRGSFGFLFDTGGGDDFYSLGGRNNRINTKEQWGVLADTP